MILTGEVVVPREGPVPSSLCPPQIPRGLAFSFGSYIITLHIELVSEKLHVVDLCDPVWFNQACDQSSRGALDDN